MNRKPEFNEIDYMKRYVREQLYNARSRIEDAEKRIRQAENDKEKAVRRAARMIQEFEYIVEIAPETSLGKAVMTYTTPCCKLLFGDCKILKEAIDELHAKYDAEAQSRRENKQNS